MNLPGPGGLKLNYFLDISRKGWNWLIQRIRPNSLHISCQGGYVGMVDLCLPESTL